MNWDHEKKNKFGVITRLSTYLGCTKLQLFFWPPPQLMCCYISYLYGPFHPKWTPVLRGKDCGWQNFPKSIESSGVVIEAFTSLIVDAQKYIHHNSSSNSRTIESYIFLTFKLSNRRHTATVTSFKIGIYWLKIITIRLNKKNFNDKLCSSEWINV